EPFPTGGGNQWQDFGFLLAQPIKSHAAKGETAGPGTGHWGGVSCSGSLQGRGEISDGPCIRRGVVEHSEHGRFVKVGTPSPAGFRTHSWRFRTHAFSNPVRVSGLRPSPRPPRCPPPAGP